MLSPSSDLNKTEGTGDDNLEEKKTILCKVGLFLHFVLFLFVSHFPMGVLALGTMDGGWC